jgi:hypothetical protein
MGGQKYILLLESVLGTNHAQSFVLQFLLFLEEVISAL